MCTIQHFKDRMYLSEKQELRQKGNDGKPQTLHSFSLLVFCISEFLKLSILFLCFLIDFLNAQGDI